MEHTSGPWELGEKTKDWFKIYGKNKSNPLAEIKPINPKNREKFDFEIEAANAMLIAAAPDLLEALQGLFKNCAMIHNSWGDGNNQKEADEAIRKAKQAIRKAEGGTD